MWKNSKNSVLITPKKNFVKVILSLNHNIFLILYFYIKRQKHFDKPIDGIVYGATASLGFATFENFDYVFNYAESMEESFIIAGVRSFSAVPMHALCGAIMGFHFGQYIFKKQNVQMLLCLLVPILIHVVQLRNKF